MSAHRFLRRLGRSIPGFVAVVFGLATLVAGLRVLAGADPGYVVFRPLLLFNTAMGAAYLVAGIVMWRSLRGGAVAAGMIFYLNFLALGAVGLLFATGDPVAVDSVRAMVFRTVVWLVLYLVLLRQHGRDRAVPGR